MECVSCRGMGHLFGVVAVTCLLLLPLALAQIELTYELDEEVQSGTFVADIFNDADLPSLYTATELSQISLRFLNDLSSNFTIANRTGIIQTRGRIDREAICPNKVQCSMRLDVAIQPVQYLKIIKVTLEISDKNDNVPRYAQPVISHSMLESAVPGQMGFLIPSPIDPDSPDNSVSRYELHPRSAPFKLSISSKSDGSSQLQLVLNRSLDREQQHQYTVQVMAYDGGETPNYGALEIQINVLDANDNQPSFDQPNYEVSIPENTGRHTTIIQVYATDPDIGHNGEIVYSFSESTQASYGLLFAIDNHTGEIFVIDVIDYETSPIYHLNVVAQDKGADSIPADVTVVVQVTDINDHAPEITVNTLSATSSGIAEVSEGSPLGTFVAHITVADQDSGANAQFNCTLSDYHFRLQYLYDSEYQLVTSSYLNREDKDSYSVTLTCADHGSDAQVAFKTIPIIIRDINDHAPTFSEDTYSAEMDERNYVPLLVLQVNATDSDFGDNAKVTYSLPEEIQQYFSVEPSTGKILAQREIDREEVDQLRFYVTATDGGDPPRSSSALVVVDIRDVNDQAPHFHSTDYTFAVYENEPVGAEVGQVTAEDRDSSQYNVVTYTFLDSFNTDAFAVDPATGQIRTTVALDRETQPVYYLEVKAEDRGSPALSGTASVTIYVNDRNDHKPSFDYPQDFNNTIYLSTQVPKGYVVTRVTAHDRDIGTNSKIRYSIHKGNDEGMFEMDHMHGTLVVSEGFSEATSKVYELTIEAKDGGEPPKMAFSHLSVVVNKSVPFPLADPHHGPLIGQNFTIVISVACVSALVIVVLVIAIVCLKRQDVDRQARKYNCRMQALQMLNKDADAQKSGANLWMGEPPHNKCNGSAPVVQGQTVIPMDPPHPDKYSAGTTALTEDSLLALAHRNNAKDSQQKVWPSHHSPSKSQDHFVHNQLDACPSSTSPSPRPGSSVSSFLPGGHPPVGVVAPSAPNPGTHGHPPHPGPHLGHPPLPGPHPGHPPLPGPHPGHPGHPGHEIHPVPGERWRQGANNRREMQVQQVLELLKGRQSPAADTDSVDSGQSSNTDSGCIPSEEGELVPPRGGGGYGRAGHYCSQHPGHNHMYHSRHKETNHPSRAYEGDWWRGILT